jgi:hypothetical protein
MILVCGHGSDPGIAQLLVVLQAMAAPFCMLELADLEQARLQMDGGAQGLSAALVWPQHRLALDAVTAVYVQPWGPAWADGALAAGSVPHPLWEWLDVTPALVVNRPMAVRAHAGSLAQARQIGAAGFLCPPVLVSSDEDDIRAFVQRHGQVLFTASNGVRGNASVQDDCWLERLHSQPALPIYFQAFVAGGVLHVLVVGRRVLAAEPAAPADWAGVELPADVVARCVVLTEALGLSMSGIDLCLRPDGTYVCLAVHSLPSLEHCGVQMGERTVSALAQCLVAAR